VWLEGRIIGGGAGHWQEGYWGWAVLSVVFSHSFFWGSHICIVFSIPTFVINSSKTMWGIAFFFNDKIWFLEASFCF
jgi:hypothetical protein